MHRTFVLCGAVLMACGPGVTGGTGGGAGGGAAGGGAGGSGGGTAAVTFKKYPVGAHGLNDLAIDRAGNVWVASERLFQGHGMAAIYKVAGATGAATRIDVAGMTDASLVNGGLSIDATGNVWLGTDTSMSTAITDQARALISVTPAGAIATRVVNTIANPNPCPNSPCQQNPIGQADSTAIDANGNIWVVDNHFSGAAYVTQLTSSGGFVRSVMLKTGNLTIVGSVALDSAGNLWAGDDHNTVVFKVGPGGAVSGPFALPAAVRKAQLKLAVDKADHVWVATGSGTCFCEGALIELDSTGAMLGSYPIPEGGEGSGIAIDAADHLWVLDISHRRLVELDTGGAVLRQIEKVPDDLLSTTYSYSIGRNMGIDAQGNVWIAGGTEPGVGLLMEAVGVAQGPQYFASPAQFAH